MEQPMITLREEAKSAGIPLEDIQLQKFQTYSDTLIEWNEKINLTAITEPEKIAILHFLDSILVLKEGKIPQNARLIDVGTGAGFPGVPLAIARPDLQLTLLDSLNKRLVFLKELCERLELPVQLIHSRAEEGGVKPELREKFDIATARAVAALPVLCEYCLPFVKVGGYFLAMKGPNCEEEIKNSQKALQVLGGKIEKQINYSLPDGSGRTLLLIKKIAPTGAKYPRPSAKMAKNPL